MVTGSNAMTIVEQPGRFPSHARRGELFPGFMLSAIDGSSVSLESYRGRNNLVVVFAGDKMDGSPVVVLLEELVVRREEFTLEAAQVLVAVTSQLAAGAQRGQWGFLVVVDDGAHIDRNVGATGRESHSRLARVSSTSNVNIQCPECGVPEWPT